MQRQFHFDEERITLPKGTRVVLRTDLPAADGYLCKTGTVGTVEDVVYDSYTIRTPTGRRIECQRDQLTIQRKDLLEGIARREHSFETLRDRVILSAVVGSVAWGLADEGSDRDIKGVFVLPFDAVIGLWEPVDEIQDPLSDTQYWEVQKLVYQGLRADANTLELLWSPHVEVCTELGRQLLESRQMFVSRNIFGTFGRYAMSQFRKMRAARRRRRVQQVIVELIASAPQLTEEQTVEHLCQQPDLLGDRNVAGRAREAIRDLYRSLFDRGLLRERGFEPLVQLVSHAAGDELFEEPRWKNAYNLLRLLCSGICWLRQGEPLIEVGGPLRDELLSVKRGEVELDAVLERADELSAEMEQAYQSTRLPEQPDFEAAHRFLLRCRERSAREALDPTWSAERAREPDTAREALDPDRDERTSSPATVASVQIPARRFEIPEQALRDFLGRYSHLDLVVCSLVGSHSYGFPSCDSDFDLKAIHLALADELLGLDEPRATEQFLGEVDGLEMDFTSHEARGAVSRLLRGDGNVLERILSPYLIAPVDPDRRLQELRALARANLSRRYFRHYGGFFRGMVQLYEKERTGKIKTLLYMFRVALTGVHLLREQQLVADLKLLLEIYPHDPVRELFALKEQAELATIDDDRPYLELVPALARELEQAHDLSPLPEEPSDRPALDDWLRRWRRA